MNIVDLYKTPQARAQAILELKSLQAQIGWQIVVQVAKENIRVLEVQLKKGSEDDTLESIKRLREKIHEHENFINTPQMMIEDLSQEDAEIPSDDPYDTLPEQELDKDN